MNFDKIKDIDLFNPYILIFIMVSFVLISLPIHFTSYLLPNPSYQLFLYIFLGFLFYFFGIIISKKFLFKLNFLEKLESIQSYISIEKSNHETIHDFKIYLKELPLFGQYSKTELILILLILFSLFLQIINFYFLGGIPLFSGILKAQSTGKLWFISFIIFLPSINILLAKYNRKAHYLLFFIGIILFALTGYRTTPIAIFLSCFISLYYTRHIPIKYIILFLALISILLVTVGFVAVKSIEWQNWSLNPLELISYRAAFTLNILDKVIYLQGIAGGKLFYYTLTGYFTHVDPRILVGEIVLSKSTSITSTILGPGLLDFGAIGMFIQMFFIGFTLKTLHIIQSYKHNISTAFYAIILAQSIIWIETGPTDIVIWIFYLIAISIIIYTLLNLKIKINN
ncbi:oligosaccharide repeat unit polymerase family protein [uncultured Methanobrevibacter sp.]|uniref:oligosaccharide repeat unit polymerase family protein n=1 Tax=uncultured Methanobrevibacter sp. TaxID=253161 RepID=UPI0025DCEEEC|nr:oligosaccharide repeat unit polymerase family protein [uncultured Methanobrevibacter sp.]